MKNTTLFVLALLLLCVSGCTNSVEEYEPTGEGKASRVKSLTYKDNYWEETFTFSYLADGKIATIDNSSEYGIEEIRFDWTTPGKLTIVKGGEALQYEVNADGYITKDPEAWGYYNAYEYDENGILIKVTEFGGGSSEVKFQLDMRSGNVLRHNRVRSGKDYVKEFEFTTGLNLCDIQQTNPVDSYWKTQCGIYGKASNRLLKGQIYGYVGEEMTSVKFTYTFDGNRRPHTISKGGKDWSETVTYTYED